MGFFFPLAALATHSNTLAWKLPWTEEPGRLQSMGSRRVECDWATSLSLFTFMPWRRKWQPTPVFLPGESQGRGSLVGCHPWGHTESDTTEATEQQQQQQGESLLDLIQSVERLRAKTELSSGSCFPQDFNLKTLPVFSAWCCEVSGLKIGTSTLTWVSYGNFYPQACTTDFRLTSSQNQPCKSIP